MILQKISDGRSGMDFRGLKWYILCLSVCLSDWVTDTVIQMSFILKVKF